MFLGCHVQSRMLLMWKTPQIQEFEHGKKPKKWGRHAAQPRNHTSHAKTYWIPTPKGGASHQKLSPHQAPQSADQSSSASAAQKTPAWCWDKATLVSRTGTERGELFYREWKGYYLGRVPNISIQGQFWRRHWLPHHLKSTYFVFSFSLNKVSLRGTGYPKTYYVARVACLSPPTASWYYRHMLPGPAQKPLCNENTKQNKKKNEESKNILENIFAISVIKGDTNHRTIAVFLWCFCLFVPWFVF